MVFRVKESKQSTIINVRSSRDLGTLIWPRKHWSINIISECINATEVIRVSRIWFSGSMNPNKVQLLMSGHHVTLERLFGQGHMT